MDPMFERLAAPFPPEAVSWRVGTSNKKKRQRESGDNNAKATKGQVLAYIDARDVMDRLDAVCGPGNWQDRYEFHGARTVCYLAIKIDGEWVTKADGAGDSDVEAEKGAISDALKRAAVKWGVGRYLYHLPTPWVELDEWEHISDAEMKKLVGLLSRQSPTPAAATATKAAPPAATMPTLASRALALEDALKANAHDPAKLRKAYHLGAGLCAELDQRDPDRLAEITALYERLQDSPAEVFA